MRSLLKVELALVAAGFTAIAALSAHYRDKLARADERVAQLTTRITQQATECASELDREGKVHTACVDTCLALDYDSDNRDGNARFVYTCEPTREQSGFACIWTNLSEDLKPKKARR